MVESWAGRILLVVVGLVALFLVGRYVISSGGRLQPANISPERLNRLPSVAPRPSETSLKRGASFKGHTYIYAEDPQRPGQYAVVFSPVLKGSEQLVFNVMRHAILTAYGQDVSSVSPEVTQQAGSPVVEFRAGGIIYVATPAGNSTRTDLRGFGLHREE